jgi:NADH-quinone oxidoreductase subunit M
MLMLLIALVSIIWASAVAFTTNDARLVIAYSSIAQLAFITLGIFSLRDQGGQGALLQMVNHGIVTAAAFFVVATVAARCGGSEDLRDMGGVAFRAPLLATMFLIVALATLAMPGSSNFIGEFMILLGTFNAKIVIAVLAFVGVVAAAYYALRLLITAMHNRVGGSVRSVEIQAGEAIAIVPLVAVILALALYPQFGLKRSQRSLNVAVAPAATLSGAPAAGRSVRVAAAPSRVAIAAAADPGETRRSHR